MIHLPCKKVYHIYIHSILAKRRNNITQSGQKPPPSSSISHNPRTARFFHPHSISIRDNNRNEGDGQPSKEETASRRLSRPVMYDWEAKSRPTLSHFRPKRSFACVQMAYDASAGVAPVMQSFRSYHQFQELQLELCFEAGGIVWNYYGRNLITSSVFFFFY